MVEDTQHIRETSTRMGDTVQRTTEVSNPRDEVGHRQNVAARVVRFIGGIIIVLLVFRFLLSLLGANTSNGLANFVYNTSHPLVSPFFNLFNYRTITNGSSQFEIFTLVAIAFYAVITWGIVKLITLNRD